jgi:hypothetical protein
MNEQKETSGGHKKGRGRPKGADAQAATFYLYPRHVAWLKRFNQSEKLRSLIDLAMQEEVATAQLTSDLIEDINSLRIGNEQSAAVSDSQD